MSTDDMLRENKRKERGNPAERQAEQMWGKERKVEENISPILIRKGDKYDVIVTTLRSYGAGTLNKTPRWEIGFHLRSRNAKTIYSEGQFVIAPKSNVDEKSAIDMMNKITSWFSESKRSRQDVEKYIGVIKTTFDDSSYSSSQRTWISLHPNVKTIIEDIFQFLGDAYFGEL